MPKRLPNLVPTLLMMIPVLMLPLCGCALAQPAVIPWPHEIEWQDGR